MFPKVKAFFALAESIRLYTACKNTISKVTFNLLLENTNKGGTVFPEADTAVIIVPLVPPQWQLQFYLASIHRIFLFYQYMHNAVDSYLSITSANVSKKR